jgi:hypothetical protein
MIAARAVRNADVSTALRIDHLQVVASKETIPLSVPIHRARIY